MEGSFNPLLHNIIYLWTLLFTKAETVWSIYIQNRYFSRNSLLRTDNSGQQWRITTVFIIFVTGALTEQGIWRIGTNQELSEL
jgi:hypothetical protein